MHCFGIDGQSGLEYLVRSLLNFHLLDVHVTNESLKSVWVQLNVCDDERCVV